MGIFSEHAKAYYEKGLSPIPIRRGEKRPVLPSWQAYCETPPDKRTITSWIGSYPDGNVGVCLGTRVTEGLYLVAIDVDAEDMVERTRHAIGKPAPTKVGKKGQTFFVLAAEDARKNRKIKRGREIKPSVEILGLGSQTIVPPSIHPDTGQPYHWITRPLPEWDLAKLPIMTKSVVDEIEAHCAGKGGHFDDLNVMVWLGVGGGGNTHDVCVATVASLVARDWSDIEIHERIRRAKAEASARIGETLDWPGADVSIQGWIDSARVKGMEGKTAKGKKLPIERTIAEWGIDHLGGLSQVRVVQGLLRHYRNGHWPMVREDLLLRDMLNQDPSLRHREAKDAVRTIESLASTDNSFGRTPSIEPREDPKRQRICLQNGTLNLRTGQLEQWDPDHEILHQLPFAWEDDSDCPEYNRAVAQILGGDSQAIVVWDEFCALSLVDDMSFQRVLFLKGAGGNGKSTLAEVLRSMHDPSAIGSVSITSLHDERKRSSLVGKLINVSSEQSRINMVTDDYFKKITGGDSVDVRFLYKEVQNNIRLSVRFLELVNEMPSTSDQTKAFQRRLIILECPWKIENPIAGMATRLISERPGILRRWVQSLGNLYRRGTFEVPGRSDVAVDQYLRENDRVRMWLEDRCMPDSKGSPSTDLYSDFSNWEKAMGFAKITNAVEWGSKLSARDYPPITIRIANKTYKGRKLKIKPGMEGPM